MPTKKDGATIQFETLEPRQFLSVTVKDGVITVIGTPGPDTITVNDHIIDPEGQEIWALSIQFSGSLPSIFRRDGIRRIRILGGDGNDQLWLDYSRIAPDRPGSIITCSVKGAAGNDQISGGAGSDTLVGGAGHYLHGGPGDDYIAGSLGNDSLLGGLGDDSLGGRAGADTLLGGPGNDALDPGDDLAADVIFGNRGGDTFHRRSTAAERKDFISGYDVLKPFDLFPI
jgi:Ca2+-binding RTX toxin-like protein